MNAARPRPGTRVVGISGGAGSGKTTLAHGLAQALGPGTALLHLDDFFHRDAEQGVVVVNPETGTRHLDMNHPASVDVTQLLAEIERWRHIDSVHTVILEGRLVLAIPDVRARLTVSVFVDLPMDVCLLRKVLRKVAQGVDARVVGRNYLQSGRPGHLLFVAPSRVQADVILDGMVGPGTLLDAALSQLAARNRHHP